MSKTLEVTKEYLDLMSERASYLHSKPIGELTDAEIKEYLNLKKEYEEIVANTKEAWETIIRDQFIPIWEAVKEMIEDTPEYQAQLKYQERVLNRSESNE